MYQFLGSLASFGAQAGMVLGASKRSPVVYTPVLSPEGKHTEANLQSAGKHGYYGDLLPMNLTSLVVGQAKRQEGSRRRTEEAGATGIANTGGQGYDSLTSGRGIGMIASEGANRIAGGIEGENAMVRLRQNEFANALTTLSNLRAMELKQAPSNLQTSLTKGLLRQMIKSQRGEDIGGLILSGSKVGTSYMTGGK